MVRPTIDVPFTCPRCDYKTKIGRDIKLHFNRKLQCPKIQDINLTPEIKNMVIQDRVYHIPVTPPTIIIKKEVEDDSIKIKYTCPRCDYTTNKITNMQTHFKRKKGCENKNNLELTDVIKEIVLQDRVYHPPKTKKDCATIKQLTLKNELLENKLKCNIDEIENEGENIIYLIQEREFLNTNVFKFGRTDKTINERLKGYSKGSIVLHTHKCKCLNKEAEQNIKTIFKDNVVMRTDIGSEYIEGNYYDVCKIFLEYCLQDIVTMKMS